VLCPIVLRNFVAVWLAVQDFVFCKEVRLGSYSSNAATLPPAAIVAAKAMAADPRAEPRYGERVPFVVSRNTLHLEQPLPVLLVRVQIHHVYPVCEGDVRP
jgi:DNA polymerase elongation subunit (family B)